MTAAKTWSLGRRKSTTMNEALDRDLFLIKEHVGMFKASSNYDIYDPETGEVLMECREENLGIISKMLRFTDYKRNTPFNLQIRTPDGEPILRVSRGISIFLSKVTVTDENDQVLGRFKQKLFSIGGAFSVLDTSDKPICQLKGKWTGWDFRFMAGDTELAHVTKKWSGLGKELFTSADNYVLQINEELPAGGAIRKLLLASVMCIDLVLKE